MKLSKLAIASLALVSAVTANAAVFQTLDDFSQDTVSSTVLASGGFTTGTRSLGAGSPPSVLGGASNSYAFNAPGGTGSGATVAISGTANSALTLTPLSTTGVQLLSLSYSGISGVQAGNDAFKFQLGGDLGTLGGTVGLSFGGPELTKSFFSGAIYYSAAEFGFADFSSASNLTLRIYGPGSAPSAATTLSFSVDNLQFIPEPTKAVFGLIGLAFVGTRRRR